MHRLEESIGTATDGIFHQVDWYTNIQSTIQYMKSNNIWDNCRVTRPNYQSNRNNLQSFPTSTNFRPKVKAASSVWTRNQTTWWDTAAECPEAWVCALQVPAVEGPLPTYRSPSLHWSMRFSISTKQISVKIYFFQVGRSAQNSGRSRFLMNEIWNQYRQSNEIMWPASLTKVRAPGCGQLLWI
jgi:hypothetical protein